MFRCMIAQNQLTWPGSAARIASDMATLVKQSPQVAILLSPSYVSHTQILRGILNYAQSHAPWSLDVRLGREGEPSGFDEASWAFSGIVTHRLPADLARLARHHRTPTVLLNDIGPRMPQVAARIVCDNETVARAAADHFVERGFTRFAYVGAHGGQTWSVERGETFARELATRGFGCQVYPDAAGEGGANGDSGNDPALGRWLMALEKPIAVFAAYDIRARGVLDSCSSAGIAVPDEVAVLGVDNDEVLCETSTPSLSSVALTHEEAGYAAAAALDAAMAASTARRRGGASETRVTFGAKGVVARSSTARAPVSDDLVRRCRALIEANVSRHFGVADLARNLVVSRRTLETRFRAATGRTVGDEIAEQRVRRAKALLARPSMSQAQIAQACGFTDASHMNVVFHRRCGAAPSAFR